MGGNMVFDACPDFIRIGEGEARFASIGPCAEEQTGFIAEHKGALGVDMMPEAAPEVVAEDGAKG